MKIWKNVLALFFIVGIVISYNHRDQKTHHVIHHIFKDGDLIFRKGTGFFSTLFSKAGDREVPYSHVGIAFVDKGDVFVIHIEANELTGKGFAKIDRIEEFLDKKNAIHAAVYRLKDGSYFYGKNAVEVAVEYVQRKTPFDIKFDLTSEKGLYCTEFVYRAYKKVGLDITDKFDVISISTHGRQYQKEIISIRSILDSHLFEKVTDFN